MEKTSQGRNGTVSASSNGADGALDKVSLKAHAAVDAIAGVAEDAASKARPAVDRVATMAHEAVDKAAGAAAPTADWLAEQGKSLKATQKKLVGDTCAYISGNPLKAVGVAVVAGFLLSRFIVK